MVWCGSSDQCTGDCGQVGRCESIESGDAVVVRCGRQGDSVGLISVAVV